MSHHHQLNFIVDDYDDDDDDDNDEVTCGCFHFAEVVCEVDDACRLRCHDNRWLFGAYSSPLQQYGAIDADAAAGVCSNEELENEGVRFRWRE